MHNTLKRPFRLALGLLACGILWLLPAAAAQAHLQHRYLSAITEVPAACTSEAGLASELQLVSSLTMFGNDLLVAEPLDGKVPGFKWRMAQFEALSGNCVATAPEPEPLKHRQGLAKGGVAAGTASGEPQVYLGSEENEVQVFGIGGCATLACASPLAQWTGAATPSSEFGLINDVAVDASSALSDWARGDVFVASSHFATCASRCQEQELAPRSERSLEIFKPKPGGGEEYVGQLTDAGAGEQWQGVRTVAVSPVNGDLLLVVNRYQQNLQEGKLYPTEDFATTTEVDLFEPTALNSYRLVRHVAPPEGFPNSYFELRGATFAPGSGELYVVAGAAVYQFDAEGAYIGQTDGTPGIEWQTSEPAGGQGHYQPVSVAVDAAGDVMVAVQRWGNGGLSAAAVDVFGPDEVVPDVEGEPVSNVRLEGESGLWSAKLNGDVNPDAEGAAECWFVWGTTPAFGHKSPCLKSVKNGDEPERVHASVGELLPGTTYYYRLQASNKNGTNLGEAGQDVRFITPGPGMTEPWSDEPSSTAMRLHASLDPNGAAAKYRFEYDTRPYSGSERHGGLTAEASLPAGAEPVPVALTAEGLTAKTEYHYRLVVEAEAEPEAQPGVLERFYGPEATFRTQDLGGPLVLADARQWELVSPMQAFGASPELEDEGVTQAASDGSKLTYLVNGAPEERPRGSASTVQMLASRSANGGWANVDMVPPRCRVEGLPEGTGAEYRFFSEDLSRSVQQLLMEGARSPAQEAADAPNFFCEPVGETFPKASQFTPLLRHDSTCVQTPATCYEPMVFPGDVSPAGTSFEGANRSQHVEFVGGTPDLQHAVIRSPFSLSEAPPQWLGEAVGGKALYEWSGESPESQRLQIVSVLPAGEGGTAVAAKYVGPRGGISTDGSRVFFIAANKPLGAEHLYMRDLANGQTLRLDEAQGGAQTAEGKAYFQAATPDGSRVFFTTVVHLTGADAGKRGTGEELYECRIVVEEQAGKPLDGCQLTDLTPVPAAGTPGAGEAASVPGLIPGISENGEYVYFIAKGVQAPGAVAQQPNLYLRHGGQTTLIATLGAKEFPDWAAVDSGEERWLKYLVEEVSANGRWLAFMSQRSLTGYDNTDAVSGKQDEEVFLYHAAATPGEEGSLVCASCNPTGARPHGIEYVEGAHMLSEPNGAWPERQWLAANLPGWTMPTRSPFGPFGPNPEVAHQPRYLSDTGRLFFNSSDALVPQDTNGNVDVYEFEPPAVGSCSPASSTMVSSAGCVSLISSGVAPGESAFMDASVTGADVFFLSNEALVAGVQPGLKVYDAHECSTAAPCAAPPPAPETPCDTAERCRPAPSTQPTLFGPAGSATFTGPENPAPPPPAKRVTTHHKKSKPKHRRHGKRKAKHRSKHKGRHRAKNARRARGKSSRRRRGGELRTASSGKRARGR